MRCKNCKERIDEEKDWAGLLPGTTLVICITCYMYAEDLYPSFIPDIWNTEEEE